MDVQKAKKMLEEQKNLSFLKSKQEKTLPGDLDVAIGTVLTYLELLEKTAASYNEIVTKGKMKAVYELSKFVDQELDFLSDKPNTPFKNGYNMALYEIFTHAVKPLEKDLKKRESPTT